MEGQKKVVDVNEAYKDLKELGDTINKVLEEVKTPTTDVPKKIESLERESSIIKKLGSVAKNLGNKIRELQIRDEKESKKLRKGIDQLATKIETQLETLNSIHTPIYTDKKELPTDYELIKVANIDKTHHNSLYRMDDYIDMTSEISKISTDPGIISKALETAKIIGADAIIINKESTTISSSFDSKTCKVCENIEFYKKRTASGRQ